MSDKIDVDHIERELVNALAADRKYSRENDAKIRAVTQRVATYDEFREIVKGSHLKPLEEKDTKGTGGFRQPWNTAAACEKPVVSDREVGGGDKMMGLDQDTEQRVLNMQEFVREWRKLASQSLKQYRFLVKLRKDRILQLFKVEISMGLLGEMIVVLNKHFTEEDANNVVGILEAFLQSSRFKLSIDFLSRSEQQASHELFNKLFSSAASKSTAPNDANNIPLNQLYTLYGH